jgi:hypothetical protein
MIIVCRLSGGQKRSPFLMTALSLRDFPVELRIERQEADV